jgi:predicted RNA-binding protein with PUA-like domain
MAYWLLKTEPSTYSYSDLERDGRTPWNGITNPTALIHLRAMKKGDLALIYHTGGERAIVGVAEIVTPPYPDPKANNEKIVIVDIKAKQALKNPVDLDTIKSDKTFAGWDLLRIGRLSVVPVPAAMWKRIQALAAGK